MIDPSKQEPWLDVHVLLSDTTHKPWQEQCLQSLEVARQAAGFPIAVHLTRGVPGHVGIARYQGYRMGSAPYVTNVDDDDYITIDAFALLKEGLLADRDAIFPQELMTYCSIKGDSVNESPLEKGRQRHSMKVFKRQHLIDHRPWIWASDAAQMTYLGTLPSIIDIAQPSYIWRVYKTSNSMPLRLKYPLELKSARAGEVVLLNPLG